MTRSIFVKIVIVIAIVGFIAYRMATVRPGKEEVAAAEKPVVEIPPKSALKVSVDDAGVVGDFRNSPRALALNGDGTVAAVVVDEGIRLSHVKFRAVLSAIPRPDPHETSALTFSPDGGRLAAVQQDAGVKVFDAKTGGLLAELPGNPNFVPPADKAIAPAEAECAVFSPDGSVLAVTRGDAIARVFDAATGKELAALKHERRVRTLAFSPDGKTLASGDDYGPGQAEAGKPGTFVAGGVKLWDWANNKEIKAFKPTTNQPAMNGSRVIAFSRDGKMLAVGTGEAIRVWNIEDGAMQSLLMTMGWRQEGKGMALGPFYDVRSLRFSDDGRQMTAFGTETDSRKAPNVKEMIRNLLRIWDVQSRELQATVCFPSGDVPSFLFSLSPDGGSAAVCNYTTRRNQRFGWFAFPSAGFEIQVWNLRVESKGEP